MAKDSDYNPIAKIAISATQKKSTSTARRPAPGGAKVKMPFPKPSGGTSL